MLNKDEIIRMAREAKLPYYWDDDVPCHLEKLERFAQLVVAAEREVVAVFLEKECDEQYLADRVRSREFNGAEKWMK